MGGTNLAKKWHSSNPEYVGVSIALVGYVDTQELYDVQHAQLSIQSFKRKESHRDKQLQEGFMDSTVPIKNCTYCMCPPNLSLSLRHYNMLGSTLAALQHVRVNPESTMAM